MTITLPSARPIGWDPRDPVGRPHQPTLFDHPTLFDRKAPVDRTTNDRSPISSSRVEAPLAERVRQLAVVAVEVLSGRRPSAQLARWMTESVHAQLVLAARRGTPLRLQVASVHCQQSHPELLEASVRVSNGDRSIAMAFRLSRVRQRWQCTAWELRPEDLQRLRRGR